MQCLACGTQNLTDAAVCSGCGRLLSAERMAQRVASALDRLAGGIFVGRQQEMAALQVAVEAVLAGQGRIVLLAGEPGIGKTRLAQELASYAQQRGARVLEGHCYEGEGVPPFWPWVQLIRSYVQACDPQTLREEMGPGAADIAQIIIEVRERLPDIPPPPKLEPEQARFRFFDSVARFLK